MPAHRDRQTIRYELVVSRLNYLNLRQQIENWLRSGREAQARQAFSELTLDTIPREHALAFAQFANRLRSVRIALRILNPIVRPSEKSFLDPATDLERIEYANSLALAGAVREAAQLLQTIDPQVHPQALLQLAFCHIRQWQYDVALPLLESYIIDPRIAPYSRSVARINAIAAYIHQRDLPSAARHLDLFAKEVRPDEAPRLYANSLELKSQMAIQDKDFALALSCLSEARRYLTQAEGSHDSLVIAKWEAIAKSFRDGAVHPQLLAVKSQSIEQHNWETWRDCDFHIGWLREDVQALTHVYFGTPFPHFRQRIENLRVPLPDTYDWAQGPGPLLDVATAEINGQVLIEPGQALHRYILILCRDLYRPAPVVSTFAQLFPSEKFNPETSANRVHQVIKRWRAKITENKLPFHIEETGGAYRLRHQMTLRLPRRIEAQERQQHEFEVLMQKLPQQSFSVSDAEVAVGWSRSATKRLLRWATDSGHLNVEGRGPKTRYKRAA